MEASTATFPPNFAWGAASAAYQIEGGWDADGKGPSVWDIFCRENGKTWRGQTGEQACDHYHRYGEDIDIMRQIGLKAYRMSISWPRVLPDGVGAVNAAGIDFYDRLIDGLCAAGIDPWVTLYHWDLPWSLHLRGGWQNRDIVGWFGEYAALMADRFSDRVKHWMTLNEIQCFVNIGYRYAMGAQGLALPFPRVLDVIHHALLAHGAAVQAIRAHAKSPCTIGCASAAFAKMPASDTPADIEAAREAMVGNSTPLAWDSAWFMEPLMRGVYPEATLPPGERLPAAMRPGDMERIAQPLDFFGINVYGGDYIQRGAAGKPEKVPVAPGFPMSRLNAEITPEAIRWGSRFVYEKYRLPVAITENGVSMPDWPTLDGKVHDPQRIDFLTRYLRELRGAITDGVDVCGYFHWSIMDNFEWHEGYKERFGLVYVDYATQRRTLKDSAYWYRDIIRSNGAVLGEAG